MAELESSLTAMDWLPRLNVGGALSGGKGIAGGPLGSGLNRNTNCAEDGSEDTNTGGTQKDGKPPYSYANLITFAINSSNRKKMTLSEIYAWICENFPYYKEAGNGWKVRTICVLSV